MRHSFTFSHPSRISFPFQNLPVSTYRTLNTIWRRCNGDRVIRRKVPKMVKRSRNENRLHVLLVSSGEPVFFTETTNNDQEDRSRDIRTLFPKVAKGVLFFIALRHRAVKSRKNRKNPSASAAIHKIRLQEIIVALHRVYLEPDGPIYNVLVQTINQPIPLSEGLNPSSKNFAQAIDAIGDALRNIISRIVDFMVTKMFLSVRFLHRSIRFVAEGRRSRHRQNVSRGESSARWKSVSLELFLGL